MSLTLDPLTDTFVEVGTEEFAELLRDPYLSQTFTSPLDSVPPGTVNVTYGIPPLPLSQLPPLPPGAMPIPKLTKSKNISVISTTIPLPSFEGLVSLPPLGDVESFVSSPQTSLMLDSRSLRSEPILSPAHFSIASPRSMVSLPPLPTI